MDPQPILLSGKLVRLEPIHPGHAPALLALLAPDPDLWLWWPFDPPTTLAQMQAIIAGQLEAQRQGNVISWAQIEQSSGKIVGSTTYLNISRKDRGLEIGSTWLARPWQRSGINTEAKYLLMRHAFETLGAVRVQLKTDGRNNQSQTAIGRLGAVHEGILRKHMLVRDGFYRDTVMFSVIAEEWPAVKARLERFLSTNV